MRTHNYSPRTIAAYVQWIKRFILFHNKTHPADMAGDPRRMAGEGGRLTTSPPSRCEALVALEAVKGEVNRSWIGEK